MTTINLEGTPLHYHDRGDVRRWTWGPFVENGIEWSGVVWSGTESEAEDLIQRLGQMARGAVIHNIKP